ncbi:MAG: 2-amino-4-hydroxy-6-hydroxymethyldihydropteridine diphosphokinase [Actinobacteria bacterium]|nr:2-amino-4-hydroxy-6-hydroxymethyldihydropteridine diphosphokinase [Actinomycetota bacterium]
MSVTAFLGLGSNLGDRLGTLEKAVRHLGKVEGIRVVRCSRIYETDPVGGPEQPDFLNAVLEIQTELSARDLLNACLDVEDTLGRQRHKGVRWGPRAIDIDVLTYGDQDIFEEGLEVPHPRMHERGFVLVPLLELTADPPLPGSRKIATLRLGPDVLGGVRLFAPPLNVSP